MVSNPAQQLSRRAIEPFRCSRGSYIGLVFGDDSCWISLQQHNGELDARTLLEFKTPFAQEPSRYFSASCSRIRAVISYLAFVLVGAQHRPSTSTAFLAKPRRSQL